MSSNSSAPPIDLPLAPSRMIQVCSLGCHAAALLVLVWSGAAWWLIVITGCAIIASAIAANRTHGQRIGAGAICRVVWRSDGEWLLIGSDGERLRASLRSSFVHPCLLLLSWRVGRWRRLSALVPTGDMGSAEMVRKLRMRLRWSPPGPRRW